MRYLFVHQNFPGQFLHLVRHLVRSPEHEVVFITEENTNAIPGVRKVTYPPPPANTNTFVDAVDFEAASMRAAIVAGVASNLKALGFRPDIIIGHHGWGELLNLGDVWPGVPLLGYYEFYYRTHGQDVGFDPEFPTSSEGLARVRNKNAVNLLALTNPGFGQTPTRFQHQTYPEWARPRMAVLPEGVDLAVCTPDPGARQRLYTLNGFEVLPGETLITYVARDLEPYRGFHVMMRALPAILRQRPDAKVIMVGGDGVSYGARIANMTWREFLLREVGTELDMSRIAFPGKIDYRAFIGLLQRSDAHVYLTYPFVASWSLREALACGCAIVASDTAPVHEFVADRVNGLLTPCLDPKRLADTVLLLLANPNAAAQLRANARAFAERNLSMDAYLQNYEKLIAWVIRQGAPTTPASAGPSSEETPG
ncbi:MAG: glycosyltransferase family 4 protein [Acetobacteraceae bacterium]|nr:glycosyltransferase family 4 protein [Acetobacteraceae bacterium]